MGYMVEVTCAACGLWRQDAVDIGMMGIARHLCSCPTCGELVIVERPEPFGRLDPEDADLGPLECPTCATTITDVKPGDPCPCGSGTLALRTVGLWD